MKKPSFQKAILRLLSNKRAFSVDSIKENVAGNDPKTNYAVSRSIKNLISDGLIESFKSEHKQYLRLTKEGKQKLNNFTLESDSTLITTAWDGFWRIILLDIPEERKSEREAIRYLLKKAGFACLKNSVWISMYPFEHLFTNIKKDLGLSSELIIIVTDKLDNETENEFFKLCGVLKKE